jgi:hypothetical protein
MPENDMGRSSFSDKTIDKQVRSDIGRSGISALIDDSRPNLPDANSEDHWEKRNA